MIVAAAAVVAIVLPTDRGRRLPAPGRGLRPRPRPRRPGSAPGASGAARRPGRHRCVPRPLFESGQRPGRRPDHPDGDAPTASHRPRRTGQGDDVLRALVPALPGRAAAGPGLDQRRRRCRPMSTSCRSRPASTRAARTTRPSAWLEREGWTPPVLERHDQRDRQRVRPDGLPVLVVRERRRHGVAAARRRADDRRSRDDAASSPR